MIPGYVDTNKLAEKLDITEKHAAALMPEIDGAAKVHGKWIAPEKAAEVFVEEYPEQVEQQKIAHVEEWHEVQTCPKCDREIKGTGPFANHVEVCNGGICVNCNAPEVYAKDRCTNCYSYRRRFGHDRNVGFVRSGNSYRAKPRSWESVDEQIEAARKGEVVALYLEADEDLPDKDAEDEIAHTLLQMRRALGWTQDDLAERSGISDATISRAERGAGASAETQQRLLEVLREHTSSPAETILGMRKALGWTQKELALRADVSVTAVSQAERGLSASDQMKRRLLAVLQGEDIPEEDDTPTVGREIGHEGAYPDCGPYGWCQMCWEEVPATREVEDGRGCLVALCDECEL